jgi:phage-related protein
MATAFINLLPEIRPLVDAFLELSEDVGPMLPTLFTSVTNALRSLTPYLPIIGEGFSNFVSIVNLLVGAFSGVINGLTSFFEGVRKVGGGLSGVWDTITQAFENFDVEQLGKNLVDGLIDGIKSGLDDVANVASDVVKTIEDFWKAHSPAKAGPLHDMSPNAMGANVVRNFAAGMAGAQPAVADAAAGTTGSALLPDNIAGADTSILTAYLRHQFSDTNGLKGFAKSFGDMLKLVKGGTDLINSQKSWPHSDSRRR